MSRRFRRTHVQRIRAASVAKESNRSGCVVATRRAHGLARFAGLVSEGVGKGMMEL